MVDWFLTALHARLAGLTQRLDLATWHVDDWRVMVLDLRDRLRLRDCREPSAPYQMPEPDLDALGRRP